ncbi:GNAT family N-acetyltransferase [Clostridium manihotivorum]|uniref:GNAT family N-acetyltransferase n=1 Tax=Clostridium manihotivorum TaxID=2320868 RepID=A0A3R5V9N4_9CLOT|nr:GNAT family N-acetyltransferase [Clostridium manihotivorum]QAA33314.1 GNAT family N-acetyltransferase [Clostridium manihotivorum]
MIIKSYNNLNDELVNAIKELEVVCKKQDNLKGDIFLDNALNFNKEINNLFMANEGERLVSIIYLFLPTKAEAEVSAYTHPDYRQKGYFKELLNKAKEEISKYDISDFLFVCESESKDGKLTLKAIEAKYDFTEYLLRYNKKSDKVAADSDITLEKCKLKHLDAIIDTSMNAFGESYEDAKNYATNTIDSKDRDLYLVNYEDKIIGMCCLNYSEEDVFLFGFAIKKEYQGRKLGKSALKKIINLVVDEKNKNLRLEVDSNNLVAFNLYKKSGFEIINAFEYYRKK